MQELIAEISRYQADQSYMSALAQLAGIASAEEAAAAYRSACRRVVVAISQTDGNVEARAALVAEANAFQYPARADPTMFFRERGSEIPDELVRLISPLDPESAEKFATLGHLSREQSYVVIRATVGVAMATTVRLAEPKVELPGRILS